MPKRKRKPAYEPGWAPANAVAWCDFHDRGMNYKYIRRKHCLMRRQGKPCKHLHWLSTHPSNNDEQNEKER